ncbi:MAG: aspartate-alanine antiporter, partial [Alphaproteobacteria bacterium]|nr:aspartate-alanine antiporter [Alphaproteobacteria bacterium]
MQILVDTLRQNPEIALFLALAIGFWIGELKFGSFSLGGVTATLIAGLLIGQLHITFPAVVQNIFFTIFLFAVGYDVGPQFIPAMKKNGLPQLLFALIICATGLFTAYGVAKLFGYNAGLAAGLLAGGYTNSSTLGVALANMHQLGLDPAQTATMASLVAIAYAVTYPFGTVLAAWFNGTFAPKVLRIDLPKVCKEYQQTNGSSGPRPQEDTPRRPVVSRSFRVVSDKVAGHTPRELYTLYGSELGAYVTRVREGAAVREPDTTTAIKIGETVAIAGSTRALLQTAQLVGPEVNDPDLLAYPAETVDIVVTNKSVFGHTVRQLERDQLTRHGRSVFLLGLERRGHVIPITPDLAIQHRDILTVRGARSQVDSLIEVLGVADRPTNKSDIAFMALGIVIGCLVGSIMVHVAGIALSLSTGVGSLLAGIAFGYIRSVYRTFGRIPAPALWVFNNVGLSGFIAAVGINAGPGLLLGLKQYGVGLILGGIIVSLVPAVIALL